MTFSESRDDPAIGYALTPTAVAQAIAPVLTSQAEVDTEACLPSP